jgi:hypothetical protein
MCRCDRVLWFGQPDIAACCTNCMVSLRCHWHGSDDFQLLRDSALVANARLVVSHNELLQIDWKAQRTSIHESDVKRTPVSSPSLISTFQKSARSPSVWPERSQLPSDEGLLQDCTS